MKTFTIDASIIVKWIFPENKNESHISQALTILKALQNNFIQVIQPCHWLAETASVVVRLEPAIAGQTIDILNAMELPVRESVEIYQTAALLAEKYNHHLFDTLYHAVALNHNATLITADAKYYRKAKQEGSIICLEDFSIFNLSR
jgi:predicted nucleic acid-binding protein